MQRNEASFFEALPTPAAPSCSTPSSSSVSVSVPSKDAVTTLSLRSSLTLRPLLPKTEGLSVVESTHLRTEECRLFLNTPRDLSSPAMQAKAMHAIAEYGSSEQGRAALIAYLSGRRGLPCFEMLLPVFRNGFLRTQLTQAQFISDLAEESGFLQKPKIKISLKEGGKVKSQHRTSIAQLCATLNSANKAADVIATVGAMFDFDVEEDLVGSFVQQCERECAIAKDIVTIAHFLAKSPVVGVGMDGTSKLDLQRSGIELELFGCTEQGISWTYLFDIVEVPDHAETGALLVQLVVTKLLEPVNKILQSLSLPVIDLYDLTRVISADNCSVNSGIKTGFVKLLQQKRKEVYLKKHGLFVF
jgi:hypothetical protein